MSFLNNLFSFKKENEETIDVNEIQINKSKFNNINNEYEIDDNNIEEDEIEEIEEIIKDSFENYIIEDSVQKYTSNSMFLRFSWNGIAHLDRWE